MSKEIMNAIAILESTQQEVTEEMQVNEELNAQSADEAYEGPRLLMQWTEKSSLSFLDTYKKYINDFSSPFTKKKTVWQKIANEMNEKHGFGVTALQCENKYKSMSRTYKKAVENNRRTVASHGSSVIFKELDDLYRHNPIVHHIGVASSSSGFQFNNNDTNDSHAEELLNIVRGKGKRKKYDIPDWVNRVLGGVERRHRERMEKYDKLIDVLDKIASK